MFEKRKALVAALVERDRVIRFADGYVIVPTESEIMQVIKDLLEPVVRGPLTTLDVKNALRQLGFYVTQTAISRWMHQLARVGVLIAEDTGPYNVFSKGAMWVAGEALAAHESFVR